VLDVNDPTNPRLLGEFPTEDYVISVSVSGGYAYLADEDFGVRVVDVSEPGDVEMVGAARFGETRSVAIAGRWALLVTSSSEACR
jgi:hypothetical protein